ncbi:unnamed protein product [Rhizophagus irregularis]|nr:unnamed protein product [Rhizophagus irregularis]
MPTLSCDPAYSQLLNTNQELRDELQNEISINEKLENKVERLKARIRILIDKKIPIDNLDMATTNLIANVNRGLERIENHIRGVGTPMQNPANVIDGIRGSLNTIRVTLQNITAERNQYQNILNDTNNRERNLGNQLRDSRNQNLRLQRLLDESRVRVERTVRERDNTQGERDLAMLAYNNERQESCRWIFSYRDKDKPTTFAKHDQYTNQEPPDEYLDNIWNSIVHLEPDMTDLENANAGDFNDAIKCGLLKTKLAGKYIPVPVQDPYNGNANIDTPARLRAWMNSKYQRENIGTQQVAIQKLAQEKFRFTDSPDTYEKRIRPLLLGIPNNDANTVGFLKSHLSDWGDLYIWMRSANPAIAGINKFFTELKNLWLERNPNIHASQNNSSAEIDKLNSKITSLQAQLAQSAQVHPQSSADFEKLNSKIASLEAQLAESMQVHSKLTQRLQLPENVVNSNNASIFDSYINQELEKRLGVIKINLAKLTNLIKEDTINTKSAQYRYSESSDYNNRGLEKRIEQIEAYLAKFARKDIKGAKTSQRQRSESSPFGGLEKRLYQIEALLAKLTKESKSRSERIHTSTADEQSNPIFSDDDASKPEDNDYNSDNSSAGSDSERHDTHMYINYGKKK